MRIKQLMSEDIVTIEETATCHEAVESMVRHRVRHLPVVDRTGRLRGVVTDRDVRHQLFQPDTFALVGTVRLEKLLKDVPVSRVMTSPAVTIDADRSLEAAARIMADEKIGSLPVVADGHVIGIVTETDLLRHIVGDDSCCPDVATIVVSYP